jgi:dephospho-CoA kinase
VSGTRRPLIVGLTGGIASGKSTVARLLAERGCQVADADRLVADLYRPGQAGAEAVRELFGESMLDDEGAVDRAALAELVFGDAAARGRLERAIHPLVGLAFQRLTASATGILVYEVPLLVETGGASRYDTIVTVEADPDLRIERAVARGVDRESALARLAAQADSAQREAVAQHVLRNDGDLAHLERQVDDLVAALRERLEAGA